MNVTDLPRNMQNKIQVSESGCWEWTGAITHKGYGRVWVPALRKLWHTHRVAYTELIGPIPEGLQIDHLCLNKACCNPAHLEPVTGLVNMRRRLDIQKDRCIRGHEMTPENTYVQPGGDYVRRRCRACKKLTAAAYEATRPPRVRVRPDRRRKRAA